MTRHLYICIALGLLLTACSNADPHGSLEHNQSQENQSENNHATTNQSPDTFDRTTAIAELREALADHDVAPLTPPTQHPPELVELGRMFFFEPELSGMRDTSCATCHRMDKATADGVPLSAGTGAITIGTDRLPGEELPFTSRNSPDLFNRTDPKVTTMFWDARMERLPDSDTFVMHDTLPAYGPGNYFRVISPDVNNILAAQVLFPVTSRREMRGQPGSEDIFGQPNELGFVSNSDVETIWRLIIRRILNIPAYHPHILAAFPDQPVEDFQITDLANALAAFIGSSFTLHDAPFDDFIAGNDDALSDEALKGALLFYGDANCASCHTGSLLTDQKFYNLGVVPMTRGLEPLEYMDLGAASRSHAGPDQRFSFRTPPLRNVELTAPYFHNGSAPTLLDVLRHKADPESGLFHYDDSHLPPHFQAQVHRDPDSLQRVFETLSPKAYLASDLDDDEMLALIDFMKSLTSPQARQLEHLVPDTTPSALPLNLPQSSAQ